MTLGISRTQEIKPRRGDIKIEIFRNMIFTKIIWDNKSIILIRFDNLTSWGFIASYKLFFVWNCHLEKKKTQGIKKIK